MKQTYFNNKQDSIFQAAYNVLTEGKYIQEAAKTSIQEPVEAKLLRQFKKEFTALAGAQDAGSDYKGYGFDLNTQRKSKIYGEIGVEDSDKDAFILLYNTKGTVPVKSTLITEKKFETETEEDNYNRALDMLEVYKKEFVKLMKKYPQIQLHHTPYSIFAYTKVKTTGEYIHIDLYM